MLDARLVHTGLSSEFRFSVQNIAMATSRLETATLQNKIPA
jgi:hypothetical protein